MRTFNILKYSSLCISSLAVVALFGCSSNATTAPTNAAAKQTAPAGTEIVLDSSIAKQITFGLEEWQKVKTASGIEFSMMAYRGYGLNGENAFTNDNCFLGCSNAGSRAICIQMMMDRIGEVEVEYQYSFDAATATSLRTNFYYYLYK